MSYDRDRSEKLLSERELEVLVCKLMGLTYVEIGARFDLSPSRVAQIFKRAEHHLILASRTIEEWTNRAAILEENRKLKANVLYLQQLLKVSKETLDETAILLEDLDLTVRCYNCLKAAKINTLGDLSLYSQGELWKLRNFGRHSLLEVHYVMQKHGLKLKQ